jgi:hypothetical protein
MYATSKVSLATNSDHIVDLLGTICTAHVHNLLFRTYDVQDTHRRNGHNELDDPSTTLPLMYKRIEGHPTVVQQYGERLQAEGVVTAAELTAWKAEIMRHYDRGASHCKPVTHLSQCM